MIPQKAGHRVTTDRRDAVHLARLLRSGALPPVYGPAVEAEALRARRRARAEARRELTAAQCRLKAVLLRPESRYTGRAPWGPTPRRWLSAVVCPTPTPQLVFPAYVRAVHEHTERLQRLAQARTEQVQAWRLRPVVAAFQALRGVQFPVAVTIVAALGDLTRVDKPRPLMSDLGLTPAAYARGEPRRQGGSTKAGHAPARRALVEGAWADRDPAHVSRPLPRRLEKAPKRRQDIRWKAQVRLCKR